MVKLCQVNKDDENVCTVSERMFAGNDFLAVPVSSRMDCDKRGAGLQAHKQRISRRDE